MNEFFQLLKKDHVELKGILGQLIRQRGERTGRRCLTVAGDLGDPNRLR